MVELLGRHAFARAASAEDADLILLNTCAVREKAEQKLLSALGRYREVKARRGALIAVVGLRRAAGEGPAAQAGPLRRLRLRPGQHRRASPRWSPGPRRPRALRRDRLDGLGGVRLPARRPRGGARPGHRLRHRDEGLRQRLRLLHRAAHPRARGLPRPSRRCVAEVRGARRGGRARGDAHRPERELVPGRLHLRRAAAPRRRGPGHRAGPLHHQPPARPLRRAGRRLPRRAAGHAALPPAGAVRLRRGPRAACGATTRWTSTWSASSALCAARARASPSPPTSSSASPARPTRTSRPRCALLERRPLREPASASSSARARTPSPALRMNGAPEWGEVPREVAVERLERLQAAAAPDRRGDRSRRSSGARCEVLVEGPSDEPGERLGRTPENRVVHLAAAERRRARGALCGRVTRAGAARSGARCGAAGDAAGSLWAGDLRLSRANPFPFLPSSSARQAPPRGLRRARGARPRARGRATAASARVGSPASTARPTSCTSLRPTATSTGSPTRRGARRGGLGVALRRPGAG